MINLNLTNIVFLLVLGCSFVAYLAIGLFGLFLGKSTGRSGIPRTINAATFTVYLPTFNEEHAISSKLKNVIQQDAFEKYEGEVLVYDCSTDRTRGILKEYSDKDKRIRVVEQQSRIGMAKTFNEAIHEAKGTIFVKTDCDSVAASNQELTKLILTFTDSRVGAATGVCVNVGREASFRSLMTRLQIAESNLDSTLIAHSSSLMAIRRDALRSVNADSVAEDTEAFLNARRLGYKAIVNADVVSKERLPAKYLDRLMQKQRRASGVIKVLLQNRDMLFDRRYGRYATIVLPLDFFLLIVSPALVIIDTIALLYLSFSLNPIAGVSVVLGISTLVLGYVMQTPGWISGILDLELAGLLGLLSLLSGKSSPVWKVHRK